MNTEGIRTLDALVKTGSFMKAAQLLGKSHSAVVYALKQLETETSLQILDRSQYRTTLTPIGRKIWEESQSLLKNESRLEHLCRELQSGWEPFLRIVFEGLIPFDPILKVLSQLTRQNIPTQIQIFAEFLNGVETSFSQKEADFMISVLPPQTLTLEAHRLPKLKAFLVAHETHPLGKNKKRNSVENLRSHTFLTVRGSDVRLGMTTQMLEQTSVFHLNDFASKKSAILNRLGYGWMPLYMIERELRSGTLQIIRWEKSSEHEFQPFLYHRGEKWLGRAARYFLKQYLEIV